MIQMRGGLIIGPYLGYYGKAVFDPDENNFYGEVSDTRDVITFEGSNPVELDTDFREAIDGYLAHCKKIGKTPEKPESGNFPVVRVQSSISD